MDTEAEKSTSQSEKMSQESFIKEIIRFAIITIFIVLPLRLFIIEPFIVNGASMDPTFATGQYLLVDLVSYNFHSPARGDVVIFRYPLDTTKFFIKRIIGLPGETVEMKDGKIVIKNKENPNGFELDQSFLKFVSRESFAVTVGEKEYFVLGDNRPQSSDSRYWGTLPEKNIVGRAYLRLYPLTKIDMLPGEFKENTK